jgi:flagellar biosynthetic protein FliS
MEQHEQLIARAIAAYREVAATRVDCASPGGLVLLLLEEMVDCLDGLGGAITADQDRRRSKIRGRAETILFSLEASLDPDAGVLSKRLGLIYREVGRLMVSAVAEHDPDRCKQARELIGPIVEAWREICLPD